MKYYTLDTQCNLKFPTHLFSTWDPQTKINPEMIIINWFSSSDEVENE